VAVVWFVAPCSLVEVYRCFRGACCLHHQGDSPDYQTIWRNNPEDRHLHTRRRENLKSHEGDCLNHIDIRDFSGVCCITFF
jgi:hypothetical protein